ncbi:DUF6355 family natural product biosynthesis protein [Lentzea albidocapillata]|uniref:Peptidase inhibitor family I36 n=1 Tax=Lentzea albidocapillata TaxID=40571 RepID=A0A1W2FSZ8_9PSEU|nr:DUF6355 family natural product biosynthesis protein [Lentzea albidocapillata]SMD24748.1 hypothetical protein SAMN05660733_07828 [Lentzea albidocapillata]
MIARKLLVLVTAMISALALGSLPASAQDMSVAACGFWKDSPKAYYTHCTSDGSKIWIRVDVRGGEWWDECVPPGTTRLEADFWGMDPGRVTNAYYKGILCNDPGLMRFHDGRMAHR